MAEAWERQPNEPTLWHGRFYDYYRPLGPGRTIEEAFRQAKQVEGLTANRPSGHWYKAAQKWNWEDRAAAWDNAERARRLEEEREVLDTAHWNLLQSLAGVIMRAARTVQQDEASQATFDSDAQLIRALDVAGRLLRLERGEATAILEGLARDTGVADLDLDPELEERLLRAFIGDDPEPGAGREEAASGPGEEAD